jgi:hypothetical protein
MREVFREASFAEGAEGVLFSAREAFKNTSPIDLVLSTAALIQGSFSKNRGVLKRSTKKREWVPSSISVCTSEASKA